MVSTSYSSPCRRQAFHLAAIVACLCFGVAPAAAQSAERIIKQAARALGGEKALKMIGASQSKGRITRTSDGLTGSFYSATARPNLYALRVEIGGFLLGEGYNGKSGWRRDSREGVRTLTGREGPDFQAEAAYRNSRWLNYRREKSKLAYAGAADVNRRPADALTLTTVRGVRLKIFFDRVTGLPTREEFPAGEGGRAVEYGDYRPVDGVLEPFAVSLIEGGERYEIELDEVSHAAPDRTAFDFPRVSSEPLPDLETLVKQVSANQEAVDRLREKYAWTEEVSAREAGPGGGLKEKGARTFEVTNHRGYPVQRLVAKDGRPLSAEEQEAEGRRVEKRINEIEKRAAWREERRRKTGAREEDSPDPGGPDFTISAILRGSRLLNARRESFRGRECVVFDFEPNPAFKPKNAFERFSRQAAGAVWVDAEALEVARLEGRLTGAVKFAAGLLGAVRGADFVFEQTRVNGEVWLPTYAEFNLGARALFFGLSFNQTVTYRDYKRFDVEAGREKLKPPTKN